MSPMGFRLMVLKVRKIKGKYRLMYDTKLARANDGKGKPADGGGHADKATAIRQLEHIKDAS